MSKIEENSEAMKMTGFALGNVHVFPSTLKVVVRGVERRIEPRIMDLLAYFAERPNQVLSKDVILRDVWGGISVVEEALQRAISILRKALNDDPENPVYIETISKKGYRLLVTPKPLGENADADMNITERNIRVSPLMLFVGAALVILLAYIVLDFSSPDQPFVPEVDESDHTTVPPEAPPAPEDEDPVPEN